MVTGVRELDEAIKNQLDKIAHCTMLGLANVPAINLAKRLVDITPLGLNKVFFSDNGSTAVEVGSEDGLPILAVKGRKATPSLP